MYIKLRVGKNLSKLLFGLIQLLGSTPPKFDVRPNILGDPEETQEKLSADWAQ